MDRALFENADGQGWWMLEAELDPQLVEHRKQLGDTFGWSWVEWWLEQAKLQEMFQFLESHHSNLLRELDDAQDLDRRRKWIDDVIQAKTPAAAGPAESAADAPAHPEATADAPPAPDTPAAPAEAPVKRSIFAKKAAPEPAAPAEPDIKQVLTELAADPDIPLESDEVEEMLKDPDFHTKLAAAEADIEAELADLEA